jgi:hypothetical protein
MEVLQRLVRCEICRGEGTIQSIFHGRMECAACNGGGLVSESGEALEYSELVAQLRERLRGAERQIDQMKTRLPEQGGPGDDYRGMRNKHHPGGGNWTGD